LPEKRRERKDRRAKAFRHLPGRKSKRFKRFAEAAMMKAESRMRNKELYMKEAIIKPLTAPPNAFSQPVENFPLNKSEKCPLNPFTSFLPQTSSAKPNRPKEASVSAEIKSLEKRE